MEFDIDGEKKSFKLFFLFVEMFYNKQYVFLFVDLKIFFVRKVLILEKVFYFVFKYSENNINVKINIRIFNCCLYYIVWDFYIFLQDYD